MAAKRCALNGDERWMVRRGGARPASPTCERNDDRRGAQRNRPSSRWTRVGTTLIWS
ncbi:hypothetical protein Dimus_034974, partial [Dionaea muscipula]